MNDPKKCRHTRSVAIKGAKPDFHDAGGRAYFLSDKLRCAHCEISWCEVIGDDPEQLRIKRETGQVVDHYPVKA